MDLMLLTHRPGPPLASYVEALWYYDGCQTAHHREHVLPNGKFQIFEPALLQVMQRGAEERLALHPSVQYALREFRHAPHIRTVTDVSKEAGLSRRRFSQLFGEQVGMTPKLYCRLIRFREVVR